MAEPPSILGAIDAGKPSILGGMGAPEPPPSILGAMGAPEPPPSILADRGKPSILGGMGVAPPPPQPAAEKKRKGRKEKPPPLNKAPGPAPPSADAGPASPQHFAFSAFQISPEPTSLPKPSMLGAFGKK